MIRDIDKPEYPLPIDPVSGWAWWRHNMGHCLYTKGWAEWQAGKPMSRIIPALRWYIYGPIKQEH